MLSISKAIYLEDNFWYRDCVPSVKTTTYVCNRFNTSFCAWNHNTSQAISNLNRTFWNKSTQPIKSTTSLIDLYFKKFFQINLCWYVLCVICNNSNWMWCFFKWNFLPYITKMRWYYECKLFKSEKWCHLLKHDCPWQEPYPRSSKLFAFK